MRFDTSMRFKLRETVDSEIASRRAIVAAASWQPGPRFISETRRSHTQTSWALK